MSTTKKSVTQGKTTELNCSNCGLEGTFVQTDDGPTVKAWDNCPACGEDALRGEA